MHLAPIYGEESFVLAQADDIPRVHVLDDNGYYFPEVATELYSSCHGSTGPSRSKYGTIIRTSRKVSKKLV